MGYFLKQIDENNFKFSGSKKMQVKSVENVEVDGEIYSRNVFEKKVLTAEDFYNGLYGFSQSVLEYYFQELDYSIKVKNTYGDPFKGCFEKHKFSERYDVNFLLNLFKSSNHKLDDRIINVFTGRTRALSDYFNTGLWVNCKKTDKYWYKKSLKQTPFLIDFIEKGVVNFELFRYGFNNSVFYSISAVDYCQLPYDKIKGSGLEILQELGLYGKRENQLKNAIRIFKEKINQ